MKREYPLKTRMVLDDEWCEDLIEMAGFGIAYWVGKAEVGERTYTIHPYNPDTGERQPVKRLTHGMLVRAVQKILNGETTLSEESIRATYAGVTDNGDIDATMADWVIQVAVLGDVLYG